MKTRADVAAKYTLSPSGTIRDPGTFEGEPWWIVNVHELDMESSLDPIDLDSDYRAWFDIGYLSPEERAGWGLDPETVAILYHVSDQGFRSVVELDAEGMAELERRAEEAAEEFQEDL